MIEGTSHQNTLFYVDSNRNISQLLSKCILFSSCVKNGCRDFILFIILEISEGLTK